MFEIVPIQKDTLLKMKTFIDKIEEEIEPCGEDFTDGNGDVKPGAAEVIEKIQEITSGLVDDMAWTILDENSLQGALR